MEPVVTTLLICLAVPLVALQLLVILGMAPPRRGSTTVGECVERSAGDDLPSFSVILPAHNEGSRLPATLAALELVRYAGGHEFVIVDDRSTDATAAIIDSFVERDSRFRRLSVEALDRRYAPKVNAVMRGLAVASG